MCIICIRTTIEPSLKRRLYFLLNRARTVLQRYADSGVTREIGVPVAQVSVLFAVEKRPGATLAELAKVIGLNNPGMTSLAQRMVDGGLLVKSTVPGDQRAWSLNMTDRGLQACAAAKPLLAKMNRQLEAGFTAEELDVVARFLEAVTQRFDTKE